MSRQELSDMIARLQEPQLQAVQSREAQLQEAQLQETQLQETQLQETQSQRLKQALAQHTFSGRQLAKDRCIAVSSELVSLFPHGGLVRGSSIGIRGGAAVTSLAFAVCAAATRSGSWLVTIGLDQLNWSAAEEMGVAVEHVVSVGITPKPGGHGESLAADVISAAMDAADLIMVSPEISVGSSAARRLVARARERGVVLIRPFGGLTSGGLRQSGTSGDVRDRWSATCDMWLTVTDTQWEGIGHGWGHASSRLVKVETAGRGAAAQQRAHRLWLPSADGNVKVASREASETSSQHISHHSVERADRLRSAG